MKANLSSIIILIVFLLFAGVSAHAAAGDVDLGFAARVEQSGDVRNIAVQADGKIIVVGNFGKFNERAQSNIARLNADGSLDASFNAGAGTNFYIRKAFVQPDGKIIIIGPFTTVNGADRRGIARLNANGSLDESFVPATLNFEEETTTNGTANATGIYSLALQPDGKMLVGGLFHVLPNPMRNLVRLNADGSLDTDFIGNAGAGTVGVIFDLALQPDGKAIAVGLFGSFSSQARQNLARLNADGTLDQNYAPQGGTDQPISAVKVLPDGKALVGGGFNYFYTQYPSPNQDTFVPRRGLARLNADGSVDTSFNAGDFPPVVPTEISVQADGKILAVGGTKTARFLPDGALDPSIEAGYVNSEIMTVKALPDGKILTGGRFTRYGHNGGATNIVYRNGLARLNANGICDTGFDPGTGAVLTKYDAKIRVKAVEPLADGKLYIAGRFNLVNGKSRPNFARLDADGSLDESFNPLYEFAEASDAAGSSSELTAIAAQPNGCVVTGGTFNGYGDALTSFINRFCGGGEHDPNFMNINNTFIIPSVFKVLPDGKILAAGFGLNSGGGADVVRINAEGGIDGAFGLVDTNGDIGALALQPDGKILIGGNFTGINNTPRRGIARLNSNGSFDIDFLVGTTADGAVNSIAVQPDGRILLGGAFNTVRGFARKGIARVEVNGEMDASFNPGAGFNGAVSSINLQPDGKIVAGGAFFLYNNFSANQIARLNSDASLDGSFSSASGANSGATVYTLAGQNGKIIAGGNFTSFGSQNKLRLVRLQTSAVGAAPFDFDGDGKTDISIFRPAGGQWWLSRSTAGVAVSNFGSPNDVLAPADYTGDGKTDIGVFRPSSGEWFILRSEDNSFYSVPFGSNGDIPTPADFDADGKADPAVFRPANGTWYISKSTGGTTIQQFGVSTDKPVAADYDGDGKADIAIYRPSVSEWWILRSTAGLVAGRFGTPGDRAVPGDYTGDGKTDTAVWRPSTGEWFILRSEDNSFYSVPFGASGDVPAPGDYDGDGRFDTAVFRPSTANWFVQNSNAGTLITAFGAAGDAAVPGVFVR